MSLKLKIILVNGLMGLVLGLAFFFIWIPQSIEYSKRALVRQSHNELAITSEALIPLLLQNQFDVIHESLDALLESISVWKSISLFDGENNRIYPLEAPSPTDPGNEYQALSHDIEFSGRVLGQLNLTIDHSESMRAINEHNFRLLKLIILGLAIGLSVIVYLLDRFVSKPIEELAEITARLGLGDYETPLPFASDDEVGKLILSIGKMRESIQTHDRDLSEVHNQLELRIEERTKALDVALVEQERISDDLSRLIDTANAPILGIDTFGHINEWNQQVARITGYEKDEAMHCNLVNEFIADEYKASVTEVLEKALQGEETVNFETPLLTKTGKPVDILLNSTTRRDSQGNIVGVVGVGQDITERNRIEAERIQLVQALENLNEAVVLFDLDDRIIFCNEAYRKLNEAVIEFIEPGVSFEELLWVGVRAGILPDAVGREDEWIADRISHHRNPTGPIEASRQNGITTLINEQLMPGVGTIMVISDITAIKNSQAQVIQTSKLATLGEMATSVAHELNQPLGVIRMASANMRRYLAKNQIEPDYMNEKLVRIENQTARASSIIDHMRMFGRKAEEKPQEINPEIAVNNALDLMREQLRLSGIEIVTNSLNEISAVVGHIIPLEQVIINLLTNARDAVLGKTNPKIFIDVSKDDKNCKISCTDTGGGVPNEIITRVFEPFYTTKDLHKGTGLGLSVCYGIIRDMNGSIELENTESGAKFTIILPLA